MKRALMPLCCAAAAVVGTLSVDARPAEAVRQFKNEFRDKYVKAESTEAKDVALAEAYKEAGCNVCHVGSDRDDRNAYGAALADLLDHELDKKDSAKIQAALEAVAKLKSDAKDEKSPTFGQLIEQGKLPVEFKEEE